MDNKLLIVEDDKKLNDGIRLAFFRLHLTVVPCLLIVPILIGIAYTIPKYQFQKMSRESDVERIRK